MEHLTSNALMTSHVGVDLLVSVCLVSEDRTADIREVYSDLMGTTRLDTTLKKGKVDSRCKIENSRLVSLNFGFYILNQCVVCHRTLSRLVNSYLRFITSILDPEESCTDRICGFGWYTRDESMIDLLYLVILEVREQCFESRFLFGDEDASTRISVDTMDECRTKSQTIILPLQVVLHLIDQVGFCSFMIS